MVTERSERPLIEPDHGVRYATATFCGQHQGGKRFGPHPISVHNRLRLLALASVFIAGCSSSPSHSPPPVERDPCLDAGPPKSVPYDNCVADREASKQEALRALLDDTGVYSRQMKIAEFGDNSYQPSDFPDTTVPQFYKGVGSISVTENRALPFKVRVTWKYASTGGMPAPRDRVRMDEMERLILPAVQGKGLAKWICTMTGGNQRQWIFYTRNHEAFIAQTQAALAQTGPYPIELSTHQEPALNTDVQSGGNRPERIRITPKKCVE